MPLPGERNCPACGFVNIGPLAGCLRCAAVLAAGNSTVEASEPARGISVVVVARNEGENLLRTVGNLRSTIPPDMEVIVVDDGSDDGSVDAAVLASAGVRLIRTEGIGAPGARNTGGAAAQGDVLIFSDAHVEFAPGWWEPLVEELRDPAVGAVAPVVSAIGNNSAKGYGQRWQGSDLSVVWLGPAGERPYSVPLLCSCVMAMRKLVLRLAGGFDTGLIRVSAEDCELTFRLWLLGFEQRVAPRAEIAHLFRSRHPYPMEWTWFLHNIIRVAIVHFSPERLARVIEAWKHNAEFSRAFALAIDSDAWRRREVLRERRVHSDDWYFARFGPEV